MTQLESSAREPPILSSSSNSDGSSPHEGSSLRKCPRRKEEFNILNPIGNGSYSQVLQVQEIDNGKFFAMKVLSKVLILKKSILQNVITERDVYTKLNHPNIIKLYFTFQDQENLFYIFEYAKNGDLQKILDKHNTIPVPSAKILSGQILLALSYIHKKKILHCDLKPENILLDEENRIKISDFGIAEIFYENNSLEAIKGSFVGSPDYASPEMLSEQKIGTGSDLWAFGCLLYALLTGASPFHSNAVLTTFKKIETLDYSFPTNFNQDAQDLIEKILNISQDQRLGFGEQDSDYKSIREHPFFKDLSWESFTKRKSLFISI